MDSHICIHNVACITCGYALCLLKFVGTFAYICNYKTTTLDCCACLRSYLSVMKIYICISKSILQVVSSKPEQYFCFQDKPLLTSCHRV